MDDDQDDNRRRADQHGSDLKKSDDMNEDEDNLPIANSLTFTHVYTYNTHEPVLSLTFGPTHTLTSQVRDMSFIRHHFYI